MKLHHFSIEVQDLDRSVSFYERFFGFVLETRMEWNEERIAFLTLGNARLELVQPESYVLSQTNTHIAFEVDDLDPVCDRLMREDFRLKEAPVILENGWKSVFISGPDDELLEFIEITKGTN